MDYDYPLDYSWSIDEITDVINLYAAVETAYEGGIDKQKLMNAYRKYTAIVDSKMAQKQYDKAFMEVSGYSIYNTLKKAQDSDFVVMEK